MANVKVTAQEWNAAYDRGRQHATAWLRKANRRSATLLSRYNEVRSFALGEYEDGESYAYTVAYAGRILEAYEARGLSV